ncbi:MAG: hypothetical protein OER80_03005 [Gammaproteobacteria bacterium]|nr:hypothetical protein [Gammaproteobacteria bacterium]MDH3766908.1 hypothetical protein [Gammaproteobacteria bacterium]
MYLRLILFVAAIGLATSISAEEVVIELVGSGNKLTDEFRVDGPWLLDWSITSEYASETGIEIDLVEAVFLSHEGNVLTARYPGAGTKLFRNTGRFRFRVIASIANWRLKVSKITPEEADAMIPKRRYP